MTKWLFSFSVFLGLLVINVNAWGQNQAYSAGTTVYTFTANGNLTGIPNGTVMKIEAIGGGGGGGGGYNGGRGGGGGGGAYSVINPYAAPITNTTLSITIGSGGAAGDPNASPEDGGSGGNTIVKYSTSTICQADGGKGGKGKSGAGNGAGGNGGSTGTGTLKTGGTGGTTSNWTGGGGGSGAWIANGNSGSGQTGGTSVGGNSGSGGKGGNSTSPTTGQVGSNYGGGGGGTGNVSGGSSYGGKGAAGVVVITIIPSCTTPTAYTVTGGGSYCSGGSGVAVGLSNSQNGVTYELYRGATLVETIKRTATGAFNFSNQTVAGTYTVKVKAVDGYCAADMTGNVAVTVTALPNITAQPVATTICSKQGASGSYSVTATGATGYDWQYYNGSTWVTCNGLPGISGAATNTMTITSPPTGWDGIQIRCAVSNTCTVYTNTITLDIDPVGTDGSLTASTPTSVCLGSPIAVTASGGVGSPKYWISGDGGASWNIASQQNSNYTSNGYTYTPTVAGTYVIHARWENSCGFCWDVPNFDWNTNNPQCFGNAFITFNVYTQPSAPAASSQPFCGSATVANLTATGSNLKWYSGSSGGSELSSGTSLSSTTYYVSQTVGCESARTAVPVTIIANPTGGTLNVVNYCAGGNITASVSGVSNVTQYSWSLGGLSGSSTTNSIGVSGGTGGNNYTVSVTPQNVVSGTTCPGTTLSKSVTVIANPSGGALSATDYCAGGNITASVSGVSNVTQYSWSLGGLSGSSTTSSIGVSGGTGGTSYTISVTPQNVVSGTTCPGTAVTASIKVDAPSTLPSSITVDNNTNNCWGRPVTLTENGGILQGSSQYIYGTSSGGTQVSGATNATSVTTTPAGTATYYVGVTANGACPAQNLATGITYVLPTRNALLSSNSSGTCYVSGSNPIHFYDASNNYIGSLNPQGRTGLVTMSTSVGSPAIQGACDLPSDPKYMTAYLGRIVHVDGSGLSGSGNVDVSLAYSDAELLALQLLAGSGSGGSTPGNVTDDITNLLNPSLGITKVGGDGSLCSGNSVSYLSAGGGVLVTPSISVARYVSFAVPSFSSFYIHGVNGGSPLPITLTSFTASCEDKVSLTWKTATETNVSHYEILRSRDGQLWEEVTTVIAAGNSTTEQVYHATDATGIETMYYKLRSVDNDGTSEDFQPVSVTCNPDVLWSIHPVPVSVKATVTVTATETSHDVFMITDINGRVVTTQQVDIKEGTSIFDLDLHHLSEGTYFIRMNQSDKYTPLKFVKVN